jgi:hypothetical protein
MLDLSACKVGGAGLKELPGCKELR